MAIVSKAFNPSDILQGPVDVWIDLAAPPSAVPPVQYTNTLQLNSFGEPPDGATTGGLATLTVAAGGSGYAVGDILEVVQTNASGGMAVVLTVSGGAIATVGVLQEGRGYSTASALVTVHRTGSGNDAATLNITAIIGGIHLGLTDAPVSFSIAPKFSEITADQFASAIDVAFVSMATDAEFTLKEINFQRWPKYFSGSLTGRYSNLRAGSTNPATDFLQIGSNNGSSANRHTLMLIMPLRNQNAKWLYAFFYKTYIQSAVSFSLDRKKPAGIKLKFMAVADTSRVGTDQVGQIVRMT